MVSRSAIEATCHAPSWEGVYGEILKFLKPRGPVSLTQTISEFQQSTESNKADSHYRIIVRYVRMVHD